MDTPEALGEEIARMAAHLDAATHRLLTCVRRFDESGEWGRQGASSCAHWLSWRIGLDSMTAREKVRVAGELGGLPAIDHALRRGKLSYAKVRALTRVATAENEGRLLELAMASTGAQLERICRTFRRVTADQLPGDPTPDERRYVSERVLPSGMVRIEAVLHPDEAALVVKAIEAARAGAPRAAGEDVPAETPARPVVPRPDALVQVAVSFLAHAQAAGTGGDRYQIFIHVEQDPLAPDGALAATLDDGTRVSAETFRRIACDASLVHVTGDAAGNPLDVGRRTRTVPPALRRALWSRDRGCRFPSCTHTRYVHAHHIEHWAHGGARATQPHPTSSSILNNRHLPRRFATKKFRPPPLTQSPESITETTHAPTGAWSDAAGSAIFRTGRPRLLDATKLKTLKQQMPLLRSHARRLRRARLTQLRTASTLSAIRLTPCYPPSTLFGARESGEVEGSKLSGRLTRLLVAEEVLPISLGMIQ